MACCECTVFSIIHMLALKAATLFSKALFCSVAA